MPYEIRIINGANFVVEANLFAEELAGFIQIINGVADLVDGMTTLRDYDRDQDGFATASLQKAMRPMQQDPGDRHGWTSTDRELPEDGQRVVGFWADPEIYKGPLRMVLRFDGGAFKSEDDTPVPLSLPDWWREWRSDWMHMVFPEAYKGRS